MCFLKSPIVSRPVALGIAGKVFKNMPKMYNEMVKLKKNYNCMVFEKKKSTLFV